MTHEERMELIHRPFFITRFGSSYPWGGVAVTDNFFHPQNEEWAERPRPTNIGSTHKHVMTNLKQSDNCDTEMAPRPFDPATLV